MYNAQLGSDRILVRCFHCHARTSQIWTPNFGDVLAAAVLGACRAEGGLAAERAARQQAKAEEEEQQRRNFESLQRVRQEGYRKVRSWKPFQPRPVRTHDHIRRLLLITHAAGAGSRAAGS